MTKKRKHSSPAQRNKPWCWYCDREFDDEKVLITHQKNKHFKCGHCHKKLNSAAGLVIHTAQIHKHTLTTYEASLSNFVRVPFAVEGHDSPEPEIFGMQGVPLEDLQRHYEGLPLVPFKKMRVSEGSLLPLLAAQKAAIPQDYQQVGYYPTSPQYAPPYGYYPSYPVPMQQAYYGQTASSVPLAPSYSMPMALPSSNINTNVTHGFGLMNEAVSMPLRSLSVSSLSSQTTASKTVSQSLNFDNVLIAASIDSLTGRSAPAMRLVYPHLETSVVPDLPLYNCSLCRKRNVPCYPPTKGCSDTRSYSTLLSMTNYLTTSYSQLHGRFLKDKSIVHCSGPLGFYRPSLEGSRFKLDKFRV